MVKVLFVCLGNICRSPAAEGIFIHLVKNQGLSDKFEIDSAGTSGWHQGEPADARMRDHARARGFELPSLSRQLVLEDFKHFDYLLAMDESNYRDMMDMAPEGTEQKVRKMTDFCKIHNVNKVPDPYYGGSDGFELVMDILEDSCSEFLNFLKQRHL